MGYKKADYIVGTMPGLFKHVLLSVDVDKSKIVNIPQATDVDFYNNHQEKVDADFINKYIPSNKFIITYAGTFGGAYSLDKVIEAAKIWVLNDKALVNTLLQLIHSIWNLKIQPLSADECATTCLFSIKFNSGRCILAQLGDGLIMANRHVVEDENSSDKAPAF